MTPYEELVEIVNGIGKEGKFAFIVDATHELTGDELSKDIKNCQYQLFHFNMVEMTFAWLSKLIDECRANAVKKIKDNLSKDAAEFLKDFGGFTDAEKASIKSLTCLQMRA